jgi:hypothetical protein
MLEQEQRIGLRAILDRPLRLFLEGQRRFVLNQAQLTDQQSSFVHFMQPDRNLFASF